MAEKFERPTTLKGKIENYWYHYKWHTLIGLFFVVTILVCTVQCSSRENPDIKAILYVDENVADLTADALEEEIEKYMTDLNGDGEVICQVINLSNINGTDNFAVNKSQRLFAEMAEGSNFLYILDKNGYDSLQTNLNPFAKEDYQNNDDVNGWNWNGSKIQSNLEIHKLPDDMYFCVRDIFDTNDSKKNKQTKINVETVMNKIAVDNKE
ncbi:MAG: hypothetical protein IJ944_04160 [Clostridia bacterium]|nr:hypothetical protein [Clostridia bacterium]